MEAMTGEEIIERKGLPIALDMERFVLGACLVSRMDVFEAVAAVLVPDDFGLTKHRTVYVAMLEVAALGRDVDHATVAGYMSDRGELVKWGGLSVILDLEEGMPSLMPGSVESWVADIREKSALRRIIGLCNAGILQAAAGDSSDAVMARLDRGISGLSESADHEANWRNPGEVIAEYPGGLQNFLCPTRGGTGLPLPWPWLQEQICGLQPGDMFIVAGRPSHGKTVVGLDIALHFAKELGVSVPYFSLEMGSESLVRRMISSTGRVDGHRMRTGHLAEDERHRARAAVAKIADIPLWIDYRQYNPLRMRMAIKRLIAKLKTGEHPPLGAVVIDHFHLLAKSHVGQDDRSAWVQASHDMKRMAKEFQVPFVVLCQLGRKCEDENREPALSDLAETSALEQDADAILFTHRPEMYVRNRSSDHLRGLARWILAKQRNGPTGARDMVFLKEYQRFEERAE